MRFELHSDSRASTLTGLTEAFHGTARCPRPSKRAIPAIAGGGMARPCRLDGDMVARRLHVPVQVRSRSRKAFKIGRDHRVTLLVNRRRFPRRTDEVNEMSRALRLLAATHRGLTSGKHPLDLEPALRPALTITRSPRRRIRAFGTSAGQGWLHQLGGLLQLGQLVCAMRVVGRQRVMSVRSSGARGDEPEARSCDAAACWLSWRRAAHPAAARLRAVGNGSAWLEAFQLPTQRARHGSVECA